ncbi:uncharacterized protein TRIREDRAFT_105220 [Trichoderma reesei QM6a]|uniref:Predicted protein n=1 Tax=Hypocrea jecorina (strain QM6a) TaxID=431241 RepID=G0REX0_HYPJQ|nr:uncharacterized protein TRIREDRAFT_105220 [Trichoderma reesei QM6a]EGR50058.1 predicted protein [Trichoderma reesei QM6a]
MGSRVKYAPLEKDENEVERLVTDESRPSSSVSTLFEVQDATPQKSAWLFTSSRISCPPTLWLVVIDFCHIGDLLKHPTAPLLTRTKIELLEQQIQTPLINRHNVNGSSIYREPPSPDVDDAWERLHKGDRLFLVGEDEVRRIGKDPDVLIKAPLEWGYGDGQYLAANQGQHDIHCLNKLRMWIYAEHYYGGREAVREIHALHCLHTLVQTLKCRYSTDVYTAMWVEGFDAPVIDFNVTRKCMKYENILHWNPERPYTEDQFLSVKPPSGQKRIPSDVY